MEMIVKALGAACAPPPGLADAPPGRGWMERVVVVDPDDAGLDLRGHAVRAGDVPGADRGCEPERRIVGKPQRVRFDIERRHRGEGAEYFFLENAHVAVDVGKHRRLDEEAVFVAGN